MPQAALIVIATLVFTGVAFQHDWKPLQKLDCPATVEVIKYLHVVEPAPILPAPQLMSVAAFSTPPSPEPESAAVEPSEADPAPRAAHPYRHHHRRHRRGS